MSDTKPPPAYEYPADEALPPPPPPPSEDPSDSAKSAKTNRSSSGGFWSSLASPFTAATAGLRTQPEPLVVPLCHAAASGNVAQVRALLGQGANINGRNENGYTSLICAVLAGQLDVVQLLLAAGADCSLRDGSRKGKPPLFHAIDAENKAAVELLIEHGADVNQSDDWGHQAGHYFVRLVVRDTAPQWIALLLSHGADATVKDVAGQPLVILALQTRKRVEDREDVVRLLLRHGARVNSSDISGTPLVYLCLQQKRAGLVDELLAMGADPNARDVSGIPLLVTAIKHNDHHLAKALLERRADPNASDIDGSHPIVSVLSRRDTSKFPAADRDALAEILLEHGARGDKKDLVGVTALEHFLISSSASTKRGMVILELLLKQGADANQRLTRIAGEPSLLEYALDQGLWDVAAVALRHRANANLMDEKGRTPLIQAVQKGNVDAVASLIQYGANTNRPLQMRPLDVAIAMGKPEIIDLLRAHGAVSANNAGPTNLPSHPV